MEHPDPPETGIRVIFDEALRVHPSLQEGVTSFESFARSPGSPLVAALIHWSPDEASFHYATDAVVSLAEILGHQRERGEPCGVRAALAVLRGVATALAAVHPDARQVGLLAHGNLNPWRIVIGARGEVSLLGYGLPDVELFAYLDEYRPGVSVDTLRYAPPERLDDQEEDARSDLYALAIIGAEMMLGRPVFDGTPTFVAERVIRGDAPELIEALGPHLGEPILDLLCVATELERADRFANLEEFIQQAQPLRGEGPSLRELVERTMAARSAPAAVEEPTPEPEPAPGDPEEHALAEPVPPLPPNPDLPQVHAYAQALVARADQLTEQAEAMHKIATQRARDLPAVQPLLRRLTEAVGRARKARSSTASTARLVELDDSIEDATITLEMVRGAESLCESATREALDLLETIQATIDEARAEAELLERARRQADSCADRAERCAAEADSLASDLEARLTDGTLAVDGAAERIERARERAHAARTAASKARTAQRSTRHQTRSVDAMRDANAARNHAEEAEQIVDALRRLTKELEAAQRDAVEEMRGAIRSALARIEGSTRSARQSLERAESAVAQASLPGVEPQMDALHRAHRDLQEMLERCRTEGERAADHTALPALRDHLERLQASAERAEQRAAEASELSDRIVARAGEAARRAAELSKLRAEVQALLEQITTQRREVAQRWGNLERDTAEVTGRIARDALQVAERAAHKAETHAEAALERAAPLAHEDDPAVLATALEALRADAQTMDERTRKALSRCREARGAASRELDEIAARRRAEAELRSAIEEAHAHAERCRKAVDDAWKAYHETTEILAHAGLDGLDDLRVRAYEVIDIAEFQAGEAEAAAEAAAQQEDLHEARSHGSTAASFEERIREDLPEALQLLAQIRDRASAEIEALDAARKQVAEALDQARDAVRVIAELQAAGSESARGWLQVPAVQLALEHLQQVGGPLQALMRFLEEADEQVRAAKDASTARALLPNVGITLRQLLDARARAETCATDLDRAVSTARAEIETRETATRAVRAAVETIRTLEQQITERSERLYAAIESHQATGETVRTARKRMRKAVDGAGEAHDRIVRAANQIDRAPSAEAARRLQIEVEEQIARVETLVEVAADAESRGVAAAEQEALEREASERRRLTQARSSALTHLNTARLAMAKCVELGGDLAHTPADDDPAIGSLHEQAANQIAACRVAATAAIAAARRCQRAERADDALSHETETAGRVADAHAAAVRAKELLQQARDLARRKEEEAEALSAIKAEIEAILHTVEDGVARAREAAAEVSTITDGSADPDTLATVPRAEELLKAATHAAAKIEAAAPMARDAASVQVAEGLLGTCRKALQRVEESSARLQALVREAQQLRSHEEERAAQRLADARSEAERPAREARALAERATAWVEAGERAADGHTSDAVREALEELRRRASEVEEATRRAERAAIPIRDAADPEAAEKIGKQVARLAEAAFQAAERATDALETVRKRVEEAAAQEREAQALRARATEAAAAAGICASSSTAIVEALEKTLSEAGVEDDALTELFRTAKETAKAITAAAARAFEASALEPAPFEAVKEAAAAAETHHKEAERLLTELRKQDRACRERLDEVRRLSRDKAKRSQDEALRARLRRKRNASTVMKREELRRQFLAERDEPSKPDLEDLRQRLRSRRRPEPPGRSGPPSAAPRRLGDRPRRKKSNRRSLSQRDLDRLRRDGTRRVERPRSTPDDSSRLVGEQEDILPVEARPRTAEEREASRRRRLERRRQRASISGAHPRPATPRMPPPEHTEVGILAPDDLQEVDEGPADPRKGADALLRRLRRNRRNG